jgi:hypothetical protein
MTEIIQIIKNDLKQNKKRGKTTTYNKCKEGKNITFLKKNTVNQKNWMVRFKTHASCERSFILSA